MTFSVDTFPILIESAPLLVTEHTEGDLDIIPEAIIRKLDQLLEHDSNPIGTKFSEGMDCYYYFRFYSEKDETAVIIFSETASNPIWLNHKLWGYTQGYCVLSMKLNAGYNSLIIKSSAASKVKFPSFRINLLERELEAVPSLITNNIHVGCHRLHYLFLNSRSEFNQRISVFLPSIPIEQIDLSRGCILELVDSLHGKPYKSFEIPFDKVYELDSTGYDENAHWFKIRFRYWGDDKNEYRLNSFVVVNDTEEKRNEYLSRLDELEKLYPARSDSWCLIQYTKKDLQNASSPEDRVKAELRAEEAFRRIKLGFTEDYFYSPGMKAIYFYSELDDSIMRYNVLIPQNFDREISHSLIINHNSTNTSSQLEPYITHYPYHGIIVDISGRGVTMASYIGEVSINEILTDLRKRYWIDRMQIFATGFSNGAYAALTHGESYPDLYAGILACAGLGYPTNLQNLSEVKVIHITSDHDSCYQDIMNNREYYEKTYAYECMVAKACSHNILAELVLNAQTLRTLTRQVNLGSPDRIDFVIDSNRHRKSYWITAHSLSDNCHGEIHARIEGKYLFVDTKGITGFDLSVPIQLDETPFTVIINGKRKKRICKPCRTIISFPFTKHHEFAPYLGFGIMDVYSTPMRVIVSPLDEEAKKISAKFSTPRMLTYVPQIDVNYPVLFTDELSQKVPTSCSFVIIDTMSTKADEFMYCIRKEARIYTDSNGFNYRNISYQGEYCIMQVLASPWNNDRSILYVRCNSPRACHKNFFLRGFVIPTYTNGFHEYYNNVALLWYNGEYYRLRNYGDDWEKIE